LRPEQGKAPREKRALDLLEYFTTLHGSVRFDHNAHEGASTRDPAGQLPLARSSEAVQPNSLSQELGERPRLGQLEFFLPSRAATVNQSQSGQSPPARRSDDRCGPVLEQRDALCPDVAAHLDLA